MESERKYTKYAQTQKKRNTNIAIFVLHFCIEVIQLILNVWMWCVKWKYNFNYLQQGLGNIVNILIIYGFISYK